MADLTPPPSDNGADIVLEQLTALLLKDEGTNDIVSSRIPSAPLCSLKSSDLRDHGASTGPPNRRPLFTSMREALESSGQLKEESGGYVIKRHSGRQQQPPHCRSAERPKNRQAKQRSSHKGESTTTTTTAPNPVEDEADAAGYTVIRRRSSCDESVSASAAATTTTTATGRRGHRTSTPTRGTKKTQQQPQRPRRGSMSALSQSNHRLAFGDPPPSLSAPLDVQPRVLRPPPGLPPAASGWVVKAAAPTENVKKIEEPPVEALWPEMKATSTTDSGWAVTTTTTVTDESELQTWTTDTNVDQSDDDDLLTRLGVTL